MSWFVHMTARRLHVDPPVANSLTACLECDLIQRVRDLRPRERARCPRCGALLRRRRENSIGRALALALAAFVLFVLANSFPFMQFELNGRIQENNLLSGVVELYRWGRAPLALLVLGVSVAAPLLKILATLYVLASVHFALPARRLTNVFKTVEFLRPWAMMEVFMLGVLVAIVKLSDIATIVPGLALYSFAALIITMAASDVALDSEAVWRKLERRAHAGWQ